MSLTTDFVAELYRAGTQAEKLTPFEARRLLERAAVTIRDMRQTALTIPDKMDERLAIIADFAKKIAGLPPQLLAHGLLDAADMIRELRVAIATTA
ncbi:hypothetical protein [Shinella sp. BYT-45]|uniref:hypothetical protein n=1 Tax=Shinella sp. BYT-45 TaxID=3377377 RepID=UPI0039818555